MKKLIMYMLVLLLLASGCLPCFAAPEYGTRDAVGLSLMGLSAADIFGGTVDDSVFGQATVTVINYWAVWCGPCLAEMPDFVAMNNYYSSTPENDVQLYGVLYYLDSSEIIEAQGIVAEQGFDWTHMVCNAQLEEIAATYDPQGVLVPQTLIVDRHGVIRAHWGGRFQNYSELSTFVSGWLEILEAEEPAFIPGDANGDGSVDSSDALLILRMSLGVIPVTNLEAVDMNGNGTVDSADALTVLRIALGI